MKQKEQKELPSVTIGIPAYNEEQNILNFLECLQKQKVKAFRLEKIFVNSDGSTDTTDAKVKTFAKQFPKVYLLSDHKRKGKNIRLQELYKKNKSDILILFDADCLLGDAFVLEKLVSAFNDPDVVFASADKVPVTPENFIEKLI